MKKEQLKLSLLPAEVVIIEDALRRSRHHLIGLLGNAPNPEREAVEQLEAHIERERIIQEIR